MRRAVVHLAGPERGLFAALLLLVLTTPFSIALSQSALALALLLGAACLAAGWRPARTGVELFALAFVAWGLADIAFSLDPGESLGHAKRFLLLPAHWLFAMAVVTEWRRAWTLAALGTGGAGVAVYGIVACAAGPGGIALRANLTQGYMTAGGIMMLVGLSLLAFLAVLPGRRARRLAAAALVPVLAALVLTQTRSAWLGFAAGGLVALLLSRPRWAAVFAVLLLVGGAAAPERYRARLLSAFDPSHPDNRQRLVMWDTARLILRDRPLTGTGDLDLREVHRGYHPGADVETVGHLHSNPAMFAAIWGWPGLVLALAFLLALGALLVRRWIALRAAGARAPPLARGWTLAALAAWTGFMVGGLFEWSFGDAEIALLLWSLTGLGLAPADAAPDGADAEAGGASAAACHRPEAAP